MTIIMIDVIDMPITISNLPVNLFTESISLIQVKIAWLIHDLLALCVAPLRSAYYVGFFLPLWAWEFKSRFFTEFNVYIYVSYLMCSNFKQHHWAKWEIIGGSSGRRRRTPPLRAQILSFWHTNFLKRSHLRNWHPLRGRRPPYGKSWIRHWKYMFYKFTADFQSAKWTNTFCFEQSKMSKAKTKLWRSRSKILVLINCQIWWIWWPRSLPKTTWMKVSVPHVDWVSGSE